MDVKKVSFEEDGEHAREISGKIVNKLMGDFPVKNLEDYINISTTTEILTNYRTKALNSYGQDEFYDIIGRDLRPFVDRSASFNVGAESQYHLSRMDYINNFYNLLSEKPSALKEFEKVNELLFQKKIAFAGGDVDIASMSNAALQLRQLETNASHLYSLLCLRKYGEGKYIIGIGGDEGLYVRSYKKPKDSLSKMATYDRIHSHAMTFLNFDPSIVSKLVPNDAEWAYNPSRFSGLVDQNSGIIGFQMLRSGQENKRFHSSLPHEIHLNSKLKRMTVIDSPPNEIYFMPKFNDDTISLSRMGFSGDDSNSIIVHNSDLASRLILDNHMDTKEAIALFDIGGSIARDMFILEKRERFYEVNGGGKKVRGRKTRDKKVVWLPRFRTNLKKKENASDIQEEIVRLSPCHVPGHPRKVKNPSQKQIDLAKSLGVILQPGETYVREYDRGASEEFKRVYKSRSAMNLLYGLK